MPSQIVLFRHYVGYYDKELNEEDANTATKGGFVFNNTIVVILMMD